MRVALVALATIGAVHAQSPAAPPAASAPMRGMVVDAAGVEIGPYSGTKTLNGQGAAAVLVQLGGRPVVNVAAAVCLPMREAPRDEAVASFLETNGGNKTVCQVGGGVLSVFEVDTVVDLATVYQKPWHLE